MSGVRVPLPLLTKNLANNGRKKFSRPSRWTLGICTSPPEIHLHQPFSLKACPAGRLRNTATVFDNRRAESISAPLLQIIVRAFQLQKVRRKIVSGCVLNPSAGSLGHDPRGLPSSGDHSAEPVRCPCAILAYLWLEQSIPDPLAPSAANRRLSASAAHPPRVHFFWSEQKAITGTVSSM